MVEGGCGGGAGGAPFPVMFYDGERQMNIGEVNISPTLKYKTFQHMLSQKIGISPNQISIYLTDGPKIPKSPFDERRRIPITGKVNFGSILCRHRDGWFLVVLKRSRKSRNRRDQRLVNDFDCYDRYSVMDYDGYYDFNNFPENKVVLLRRDAERINFPIYDEIARADLDYCRRLEESTLGVSGLGLDPYLDPDDAMVRTVNDVAKSVFCEECDHDNSIAEKSGERASSFHHCVNDPVVIGWVTSLGPIGRPGI